MGARVTDKLSSTLLPDLALYHKFAASDKLYFWSGAEEARIFVGGGPCTCHPLPLRTAPEYRCSHVWRFLSSLRRSYDLNADRRSFAPWKCPEDHHILCRTPRNIGSTRWHRSRESALRLSPEPVETRQTSSFRFSLETVYTHDFISPQNNVVAEKSKKYLNIS